VNELCRVLIALTVAVSLASASSAAPAPLAKAARRPDTSEESLLRALRARGVVVVWAESEQQAAFCRIGERLDGPWDGRSPRTRKVYLFSSGIDRRAVLRELLEEVTRSGRTEPNAFRELLDVLPPQPR